MGSKCFSALIYAGKAVNKNDLKPRLFQNLTPDFAPMGNLVKLTSVPFYCQLCLFFWVPLNVFTAFPPAFPLCFHNMNINNKSADPVEPEFKVQCPDFELFCHLWGFFVMHPKLYSISWEEWKWSDFVVRVLASLERAQSFWEFLLLCQALLWGGDEW